MKNTIIFLALFLLLVSCKEDEEMPAPIDYLAPPPNALAIPENENAPGDPDAGRDYLFTGDFEESGIPFDLYTQISAGSPNLLNRTGDNALVPYNTNVVLAPNGVKVVAPNCFTCHAQELNGELIVGLGNSLSDYTEDQTGNINQVNAALTVFYGADSPEYEAFQPLRRATLASAEQLVVPFKGPNSASKLTAVLGAHRDPVTLEWRDEPAFPINADNLPSDVPAWWILKKKNVMFNDASARGDFRKYTMASSLLTLEDVNKAEEVYENFDDVVAYLNSMEAPVYPGVINEELHSKGAELFYQNCAKCHGTYGDEESYPNLLIPAAEVGTDPFYTLRNGAETDFLTWWDEGWFGTSHEPAYFDFNAGYYAPPLDGVWATAPYLHNGSVPDLATLLDSEKRPTYWKRNFNNPQYNADNTGWTYEVADAADGNPNIYDTTIPGYGKEGHYYADSFSEEERAAVIEYLKGL